MSESPQATTVTPSSTQELSDSSKSDSNQIKAPATPETKVTDTPKQPEIRKLKVKIDGKEMELTEDEVIRDYQVKKLSDQKMMTATKLMEEIEKDPEAFLQKKYGDKVTEVAERIIARKLERELETPEQTELRELREYKAQREQEREANEKEKAQTEEQSIKAKYADEYKTQIMGVLETSGLPQTTGTVRRVAYYMQQALERGQEKSASEVIHLVKADYLQEIKELTQGWDAKQIEESFGSDVADKLRKATFEKVKTPQDNLKTPSKQAVKDGENSKRKRIPLSQWGRS